MKYTLYAKGNDDTKTIMEERIVDEMNLLEEVLSN